MDIHFLGTVGWHPNGTRQTSCIAIPKLGVVFDAGTGFPQLQSLLQTRELSILLTHYHYDHIIGLITLKQFDLLGLLDKATIYGRAPIDAVKQFIRDPYFPLPLEEHLKDVQCKEWSDGQDAWELPGGTRVTAELFPHSSGGSLGYRLETVEGSVVVYITDTMISDDGIALAQGADVLICEANFTEAYRKQAEITTHSTAAQAATLAKRAGVDRLVLTHLDAVLREEDALEQEAKAIFPNVQVASDGFVVSL